MLNVLNFFNFLVIYPITQIIEITYVLIYKVFDNHVLAVLGVSVAVTFLCLPLYVVAEKWQETERKKVRSLKPVVDVIKAVFSGDEQYMILSTYYRQNNYHPIYALRSSFGILIQIPFFLAAYTYLSRLETLKGVSFLFIRDLGSPDAFTALGGLSVNILPILMTAINCAAGAVYTKGLGARDKLQVYGMAAVFLLVLYNSPAGLVLYWTMNNIFSLAKNIFYRLKHPLRVLYVILSLAALVFICYLLFGNTGAFKKRLVLIGALSVIFFAPLLAAGGKAVYRCFLLPLFAAPRQRGAVFALCCLSLALLAGLFIPSSLIASSPQEFSFIDQYATPFPFIVSSLFQALGFFCFWPLCIYFLFNGKIKTILALLSALASFYALVNTVVFQGDWGSLSNTFVLPNNGMLRAGTIVVLLNLLCFAGLAAVFLFLFRKNKLSAVSSGCAVFLLTLVLFSGYNLIRIYSGFRDFENTRGNSAEIRSIEPVFSLSREKKNLVVFMIDGAVNGYVEPIFAEHPFLPEQFDGFTLYPNTVSFGSHTIFGAPPLWGGYEYTPAEMNRRDTVPLVSKHNEALLLLPRILSGAGFRVTVTDPSWANYSYIADTTIYRDYDGVEAFNTIKRYSNIWYEKNHFGGRKIIAPKITRNAIWFSFLKIAPPSARQILYDDGWYWGTDDMGSTLSDFINNYAVLDFLPELTRYDSPEPRALLLTNELTHESAFLEIPGYVPAEEPGDKGGGPYSANASYHSNSAFLLRFGEWLDALRENGVYDNTRIIIVSDHGSGVGGLLAGAPLAIPETNRERVNPILLVKDFNAHGELSLNGSFMTNADVPLLALKGIVEKPVNPFTGKILAESKSGGALITINHIPMAYQHDKYVFKIKKDQWVLVRDNILEENNWRQIEQ
ncbi:MAG: YidC/Oxa1 family membrane protein insertase [Treponema sp.]|jgi:YidC/Oxa1 family membrane protein insertase|nr:YidC/Oxa1 family membrane protein insertase [Treponema sp.]